MTQPLVLTWPPGAGCVDKPSSPQILRVSSCGVRPDRDELPARGQGVRNFRSVEAVAAGARAGGVGIVDGEALLLDRVNEIDRCAHQVWRTHPVGDHAHAAEDLDDVAFEAAPVRYGALIRSVTTPTPPKTLTMSPSKLRSSKNN